MAFGPSVVAAILVVESQPFIRLDIIDFLESVGWIAFAACDGREADDRIAEHPEIELLVTGDEFSDELRAAHPTRRFVVATSLVAADGLTVADGELLPSPFKEAELIAAVGRQMNGGSAH